MSLFERWLTLRGALCILAGLVLGSLAPGLFGLNSGPALATVVGVPVDVPAMPSLVAIANRTPEEFPA